MLADPLVVVALAIVFTRRAFRRRHGPIVTFAISWLAVVVTGLALLAADPRYHHAVIAPARALLIGLALCAAADAVARRFPHGSRQPHLTVVVLGLPLLFADLALAHLRTPAAPDYVAADHCGPWEEECSYGALRRTLASLTSQGVELGPGSRVEGPGGACLAAFANWGLAKEEVSELSEGGPGTAWLLLLPLDQEPPPGIDTVASLGDVAVVEVGPVERCAPGEPHGRGYRYRGFVSYDGGHPGGIPPHLANSPWSCVHDHSTPGLWDAWTVDPVEGPWTTGDPIARDRTYPLEVELCLPAAVSPTEERPSDRGGPR